MGYQIERYGYAFSDAEVQGLIAYAPKKHQALFERYCFVEKRGERKEFDKMLALMKQHDGDYLFISSVKDLAGDGYESFKEKLEALDKALVQVYSIAEPNYDYADYKKVFDIVDDLMPSYVKSYWCGVAAVLNEIGGSIEKIREHVPLSEAEIYQSIADYKRDCAE